MVHDSWPTFEDLSLPVPPVVVCATEYGNNFLMIGIATPSSALYGRFSHIFGQGRWDAAGLTPQSWTLLARAG